MKPKHRFFNVLGLFVAALTIAAIYVSTTSNDDKRYQTKNIEEFLRNEYQRQEEEDAVSVKNSSKSEPAVVIGQLSNRVYETEYFRPILNIRNGTLDSDSWHASRAKSNTSSSTGDEMDGQSDALYTHHGYISVRDPEKKLSLHCGRCAYVSSSGRLLHSGSGHLIDQADCIFRMNDATVSGYEADVGSRTTVRVVAHSASPNLRNKQLYLLNKPSPPRYIIGWGPTKQMRTTGTGYAFNLFRDMAKAYRNVEIFYLTQDQMKVADTIFEAETGRPRMNSGTYLSTGWFTMLLARSACDEIDIYGMVPYDYCQNKTNPDVPYHYYDKLGKTECSYYQQSEKGNHGFHRFITEKAIFANWALQLPIRFHVPEWTP